MNVERRSCELLLFHSTTKSNLKMIMKEGLKPGMKGGWVDLWIKNLEKENLSKEELEKEKNSIELYRTECEQYIFLSPDFHALEQEMPWGSETILIVCIPKRMAYIPSLKLGKVALFDEWVGTVGLEMNNEYKQVLVKETISPSYIIGCLDVDNPDIRSPGSDFGDTTFRINKNCNFGDF